MITRHSCQGYQKSGELETFAALLLPLQLNCFAADMVYFLCARLFYIYAMLVVPQGPMLKNLAILDSFVVILNTILSTSQRLLCCSSTLRRHGLCSSEGIDTYRYTASRSTVHMEQQPSYSLSQIGLDPYQDRIKSSYSLSCHHCLIHSQINSPSFWPLSANNQLTDHSHLKNDGSVCQDHQISLIPLKKWNLHEKKVVKRMPHGGLTCIGHHRIESPINNNERNNQTKTFEELDTILTKEIAFS